MVEETISAVTNELCLKAKHSGTVPEDIFEEKILPPDILIGFKLTLFGKCLSIEVIIEFGKDCVAVTVYNQIWNYEW